MKTFLYSLVILSVTFLSSYLYAKDEAPPKVGIVEKLGQNIPLDAQFYDETGQLVTLKSIVDKPTILTLVYYRCPSMCPALLHELVTNVKKAGLELGKDYRILTVSFDQRETPDLAADKKQSYMTELGGSVDPKAWRFLTGDSANIHRLTNAAGFYFMPSPDKNWIHPTALIFLSPEGKITRYIDGVQYLPFDIKMAVIEASNGKVGPTVARILQLCFTYDPEGHRYTLNIVRVAGACIIGLVGVFVIVFLVKPKKKKVTETKEG
jgi:protein SCO1/2